MGDITIFEAAMKLLGCVEKSYACADAAMTAPGAEVEAKFAELQAALAEEDEAWEVFRRVRAEKSS